MTLRRPALPIAATALACALVAGCVPGGGGGGVSKRYVDRIFAGVDATTNVVYATAPDLQSGDPVALRLDWYQPSGDRKSTRPAIVWIHGGGFKSGAKSATTQVATEYAQRGYVTVSIDYRLDPGNRCQDLQDGRITDPDEYQQELARCQAAILAAQHDAQAVVRWVRANAGSLRVDPSRIAAGGFSAGAVTAVHVAQRSDDPGDVGDNDGLDSTVAAALVASGCSYDTASIDGGDAPLSMLASEFDQAVPFACVTKTADLAEGAGVDVQRLYYYGTSQHAKTLYEAHKTETDRSWTTFLVAELGL